MYAKVRSVQVRASASGGRVGSPAPWYCATRTRTRLRRRAGFVTSARALSSAEDSKESSPPSISPSFSSSSSSSSSSSPPSLPEPPKGKGAVKEMEMLDDELSEIIREQLVSRRAAEKKAKKLQSEVEKLGDALDSLKDKNAELALEREELQAEVADKNMKIERMSTEIDTMYGKIRMEVESQLLDLSKKERKRDKQALESELREARQRAEDLRAEVKRMRAANNVETMELLEKSAEDVRLELELDIGSESANKEAALGAANSSARAVVTLMSEQKRLRDEASQLKIQSRENQGEIESLRKEAAMLRSEKTLLQEQKAALESVNVELENKLEDTELVKKTALASEAQKAVERQEETLQAVEKKHNLRHERMERNEALISHALKAAVADRKYWENRSRAAERVLSQSQASSSPSSDSIEFRGRVGGSWIPGVELRKYLAKGSSSEVTGGETSLTFFSGWKHKPQDGEDNSSRPSE